jgi:hypothetical protein
VGGLAGVVDGVNSKIEKCYVVGLVRGTKNVGGLVGAYSASGSAGSGTAFVEKCFTIGVVIASIENAGGLIGYNATNVKSCYASVYVIAPRYAGGLNGCLAQRIENTYAIGKVIGSPSGGLTGFVEFNGNTQQSFFDPTMSLLAEGAGNVSNPAELAGVWYVMNDATKYLQNTYEPKGWLFPSVWNILENKSYPYFEWQSAPVYVNALYVDSANLFLQHNVDSIIVFRYTYNNIVQHHKIGVAYATATLPMNIPAVNMGDTLYFVAYQQGNKVPSYPVRAVVRRFPLTIETTYGNTSTIYGEAIDPARYRKAAGVLRSGAPFYHTIQSTLKLNASSSQMSGGTPQHVRVGVYPFEFVGTKIMQSGADVTNLYEINYVTNYDTVKPRTLYIVPDQNQTKVYGAADPCITYTYGNIFNWASGEPFYGQRITGNCLGRDQGENVRAYPIQPGLVSLPNYIISTINPTNNQYTNFVIMRASNIPASNISFTPASITYDGQRHDVGINTINGVGQVRAVRYYLAGRDTAPINAGIYSIKADFDMGDNYQEKNDVLFAQTYTINKAVAAASLFDYSSSSNVHPFNNEPRRANVLIRQDVVGLDSFVVLYSHPTIALYQTASPVPPKDTGTYNVMVNTFEGANYLATSNVALGTLTINEAPELPREFILDFVPKFRLQDDTMQRRGIDSILWSQPSPCVHSGLIGGGTSVPQGSNRFYPVTVKYQSAISTTAPILTEPPRLVGDYYVIVDVEACAGYYGPTTNRPLGIFSVGAVDSITAIDSIVINTDVSINDSVYRNLDKNNNEIFYPMPCGMDNVIISINAQNRFAAILYKGGQQNPLPIRVRRYGQSIDTFQVVSTRKQDTAMYILHLDKPIPFDSVVVLRWNKVMTVMNNPIYNGGYIFGEFAWYANGALISRAQTIPDAYSGYQIDTAAIYSVALTTISGERLRSCPSVPRIISSPAPIINGIKLYPNPIPSGGTAQVQISQPIPSDGIAVEFYDINGRMLRSQTITASPAALHFPFPAGTYIVRCGSAALIVTIGN